ncbi:MAG: polyamine ABC transporter substrate-binding protein [Acidimicrobiales bacterium]
MVLPPPDDAATSRGKLSRRRFLETVGTGAAALAAGGALSACAAAGASVTVPLPRQDNPVRWPIYRDNPMIASGMKPETGATLQIYNWVAYINSATIANFCKKYRCHAQVTTFNTMDEAIAKLQSGQLNFDVFIPTVDVLGPLVLGKLLQPLNPSYLPNREQTWPQYHSPFYDLGAQYTVPYTVYTTGVGYRKDLIDQDPYRMSNPWSILWNPKYFGRVGLLDDYREGMALGMLKAGIHDLNTTSVDAISTSFRQLKLCETLTGAVIDNNDYTEVPTGQTVVHHGWSGDMAAAWYYLPKGVKPEVLGYWYPPQGGGPVANDTMAVLRSAKSPVLAHLFLNYFLDQHNALSNISYTGYQQPIQGITPDLLIKEQLIPPSLRSTTVPAGYFHKGVFELELPIKTDQQYQEAWTTFGGGL